MKLSSALFVAVLLTASMQQASCAGNQMPANGPSMQAEKAVAGTKASATGTVKVVDTAAGNVTISHGPVAALNWPAMTMAFKATRAQLATLHAGQKVDFEFVSRGMDGTLTRVEPAK